MHYVMARFSEQIKTFEHRFCNSIPFTQIIIIFKFLKPLVKTKATDAIVNIWLSMWVDPSVAFNVFCRKLEMKIKDFYKQNSLFHMYFIDKSVTTYVTVAAHVYF